MFVSEQAEFTAVVSGLCSEEYVSESTARDGTRQQRRGNNAHFTSIEIDAPPNEVRLG